MLWAVIVMALPANAQRRNARWKAKMYRLRSIVCICSTASP